MKWLASVLLDQRHPFLIIVNSVPPELKWKYTLSMSLRVK